MSQKMNILASSLIYTLPNTFRSIIVIAELSNQFGTKILSYLFDYGNKIWSEYQLITTTTTNAKSETFLLYVHGILYLLTPDAQTYTFDVRREQWKMSITSLIDPKTHRISKQLSTIRLSNLDILG